MSPEPAATWMCNLRTLLFALIFGLFSPGNIPAQTQSLPATPQRYITDQAGVLDSTTLSTVDHQLEQFDKDTTNQVVVAIYTSLPANTPIDQYCTDTFNAWGVGQKGKDNGAILFVFINNHQMVIRTGRGFAKVLPDAICKTIITQIIAPRFKAGDFSGGVRAGVNEMLADIQKADVNAGNH